MINTMKKECYGCGKRELLVYLSCGCNSICENCVKNEQACCEKDHKYDKKVYIKWGNWAIGNEDV